MKFLKNLVKSHKFPNKSKKHKIYLKIKKFTKDIMVKALYIGWKQNLQNKGPSPNMLERNIKNH